MFKEKSKIRKEEVDMTQSVKERSDMINLIFDLEDAYMAKIKNQTLQELAQILNMELHSTYGVKQIASLINYGVLKEIMANPKFLSLPIIAHYRSDNGHNFVFATVGNVNSLMRDEMVPIYKALHIGKDFFGIIDIVADTYSRDRYTEYEVIGDVLPLMSKYISLADIPTII